MRTPGTFYYVNSGKVYKTYIEFDTEQAENTKNSERQKTSFSKESIENADFYKFVFNKIMTTYE